MSQTRAFTAADLGLTGPLLVARPGTEPGWERIIDEVLSYAWEWRGSERVLCAVTRYRSPGSLEGITLPLPVGDLFVTS